MKLRFVFLVPIKVGHIQLAKYNDLVRTILCYVKIEVIIKALRCDQGIRGQPFNHPRAGGGLQWGQIISFQPGSAARGEFKFVLHVYIEQFLK